MGLAACRFLWLALEIGWGRERAEIVRIARLEFPQSRCVISEGTDKLHARSWRRGRGRGHVPLSPAVMPAAPKNAAGHPAGTGLASVCLTIALSLCTDKGVSRIERFCSSTSR